MMDAQRLAKAIRTAHEKLSAAEPLGATALFDFKGDGGVFVDGRGAAPLAREARPDDEADCAIKADYETFLELMNGDLNPATAFMMGRISIDGSMGVAMKLASLLG